MPLEDGEDSGLRGGRIDPPVDKRTTDESNVRSGGCGRKGQKGRMVGEDRWETEREGRREERKINDSVRTQRTSFLLILFYLDVVSKVNDTGILFNKILSHRSLFLV